MPNNKGAVKRNLEEFRKSSSDSKYRSTNFESTDDSDSVFRKDNDKLKQYNVEKRRSVSISERYRRQERSISRDESSRSSSRSVRGRSKKIERNSVSRSGSNESSKKYRNRQQIFKLKRGDNDYHKNLDEKHHSKKNRRSSSSDSDRSKSIDRRPRKSRRKKSESRERKARFNKNKRSRSSSSSESLENRKTNFKHHRRHRSRSSSKELITTLKTLTPNSRSQNTKNEIIEHSPEKKSLLNSINISNSVANSSYNIMMEVNSNVPQRTVEPFVKIPVQSSAGTIVKDCFSVGARPDVTAVRDMPYICGACEQRPVAAEVHNGLAEESRKETGPSTTSTTAIPFQDGKRRYMLATQLSDHLKLKHNIHIHPSLLKPNKAFPPLASPVPVSPSF